MVAVVVGISAGVLWRSAGVLVAVVAVVTCARAFWWWPSWWR